MVRKAFRMEVKPGRIEEYRKAHNPIWPELKAVLKEHGLSNYSIFYHPEKEELFGYVEVEDEEKLKQLPESEVCRKWWKHMTEFLVCHKPGDQKAKEEEMIEVFHLD